MTINTLPNELKLFVNPLENAECVEWFEMPGLVCGVYIASDYPLEYSYWISFARTVQQLESAPKIFQGHSWSSRLGEWPAGEKRRKRLYWRAVRREIRRVNPKWLGRIKELDAAASLVGVNHVDGTTTYEESVEEMNRLKKLGVIDMMTFERDETDQAA